MKVFSHWYCHFRCVWPDMSKLLKIASLLFLCNMLRKKWCDAFNFFAFNFLHAYKHESLLQIDTKIFWWLWSSIPEVPKKENLQCLYNIPKKVRDEVDFFDADKHQSFLTVYFNTLGIKVFYNVTDMIMKTWRTWWWEWSSILKVLKVTSLQCLYNISKKKLWMKFSIFDVSYQFLMKVARRVQSAEKGSLLNFSNIFKKVLQLVLCSTVMQNIHILY